LIQLFDPPFDRSELEPGYIKGYMPGVRENGGQYTHAAIWTVMAFAQAGDNGRAWEFFKFINPLLHAHTPDGVARYQVEPYVMAADVYSVPPREGRGGWTWYTGSAGWMYRLIVEGNQLHFMPHMPAELGNFRVRYRYQNTFYSIVVVNAAGRWDGPQRILVDGQSGDGSALHLIDDGKEHEVEVSFG